MSLLKIEHINTGYGKKQVLFDVSLEVNKGETVLLIGSNGSGKSTLLKAIYGLLKPWDKGGKIWFDGEEITNCKPYQLIRRGMVYIPQQNELFEDLSVKDNLEVSGMQTLSKNDLKIRIEKVLEDIPALKNILKQECSLLSGGERKQLSLAMALINQPKLILIDEPLAGISPKNTSDIIQQIVGLKKVGIGMILVEHRVKDSFELADKVIGLKLGELVKENIESLDDSQNVML